MQPSSLDPVRALYDASAGNYSGMMDSEIDLPMYADTLGRLAERLVGMSGPVVDASCGSGHMLARYRDALSRWQGTNDDRIGLTISGSAPQRCTDGYLQALSVMAREHNLSFDLHVYETKTQRVMGEEVYG